MFRLSMIALAGAAALSNVHAAEPLDLDGLVRQSIDNHPSISARLAAVSAARSGLDEARQQYYPTPSIQNLQGSGGSRTSVLALTQPVWTAGRLGATVDGAAARLRSARIAVRENEVNLGLSVSSAFQSFLQARYRNEALRAYIVRLRAINERMTRRVETGVSAQGELDLLRSRIALAEGQRKSTEFSESVSVHQLAELVRLPLAASDLDSTRSILQPPPREDDVVDRAENYSPTLQRLTYDIDAARSDAKAKSADLWPTLALVAQRNLVHNSPSQISSTTFGLQLQYSPGAGTSAAAASHAADAQIVAQSASREASRSDLVTKVHGEFGEYAAAIARRPDLLLNITAADNVMQSYERLFVGGKRSLLDVMNAAREVSDAEVSLADLDALLTCGRYRLAVYSAELPWMGR